MQDAISLKGLSEINSLSGIRGRWEIIRQSPITILETGHNEEAILMIVHEITFYSNVHLIWFSKPFCSHAAAGICS